MILTGVARLGRNAELRDANGQKVCNLALAYNYGRATDGQNRPTQWVDAALWGRQAEMLSQWLLKGREVWVTVRDVHVETGTKQDGSTWNKLTGTVTDIQLVGPKSSDTASAPASAPAAAPRPAPSPAPAQSNSSAPPF